MHYMCRNFLICFSRKSVLLRHQVVCLGQEARFMKSTIDKQIVSNGHLQTVPPPIGVIVYCECCIVQFSQFFTSRDKEKLIHTITLDFL